MVEIIADISLFSRSSLPNRLHIESVVSCPARLLFVFLWISILWIDVGNAKNIAVRFQIFPASSFSNIASALTILTSQAL